MSKLYRVSPPDTSAAGGPLEPRASAPGGAMKRLLRKRAAGVVQDM
ncbi:hypothetical protein [Sorangium sp. So ce117]